MGSISPSHTGESIKVMGKKILAAMSGGVDSSVAALLLHKAGHTVAGVTMCLGIQEDGDQTRCCGREAIEDAQRVCARIGISHYVIDCASDFQEKVITPFVREYRRGRTPNPCIECNRHLKFGKLLELARSMGFDAIATGHYARIERREDGYHLMKPRDHVKDQTYFLYSIRKEDLPSIVFPLADVGKKEVRSIAGEAGLPVSEKPESQDICFITQKDYRTFIREHSGPEEPGDIVDGKGRTIGRHRGITRYTVGQRSGLGISAALPLYVVSIDAVENRIVVGEKHDLLASGLIATDINFLVDTFSGTAKAKVRYRRKAFECQFAAENARLEVTFSEPQESISPGQAVVLYQGDEVLGGGVIDKVLRGRDF